MFRNKVNALRSLIACGGLTLAGSCFAVGADFSSLTAAVDFGTAIAALLLVMAGLAGVYIVWTGGSLVIGKLKAGK